ncbi:hypothetical protein Pmar_PMAR026362 [Perkinsus marinus ATCC 50983]|uniref:Uncharacterized protein n=1 Tax=Perkinsus marinus (strain ATCC 50983 / TXsc) TaxID=423536 RepID=C5LEJ2_PERM5|nr:hypothetical protein Pmar_PMAR026362 [Perkinsus marinus ATCC 50983]EER04810.1 hypothetical protein Pmar_PMAR026362 [Perkinsus marinus ATCC 50983]|eukprot:XP_002772994.1 hypothetical protein Pmar_PMAR026362 [Perkinsus marinus ATCC 50983]
MFFRISVATIALISLAEGIVVGRSTGDEESLCGSLDPLECTPELINLVKELEAELIEQDDEERIASYHEDPQLAAVSADGSFSYPPGCTPDVRPQNRYYCFHGKRNTTGKEKKQVTAIVDLFDINDPQDNVVIGLTAEFECKTAMRLSTHAGGEAEVVAFGNKKRLGAYLSLATYDVETPKPGLLGRVQKNLVANPHFKIYVFSYLALDIEHLPSNTSYMYATNAGNMGFNVTTSISKKVTLGTVDASFSLTLDTLKANDSIWDLKGTAKASVTNALIKLHFPVTFLRERIILPQ